MQIQLIIYLFCFSVRAIRGSQDVTIRVSDQGGGIPRRMTDTLFEYLYTTAPTPALTSSVDMPGIFQNYCLVLQCPNWFGQVQNVLDQTKNCFSLLNFTLLPCPSVDGQ